MLLIEFRFLLVYCKLCHVITLNFTFPVLGLLFNKRMCSLLVIWPETASDHLKSLLLKEIDAMKSLNPHSNVLQLLGYCVDEGWCSGIEAIDLIWLN